MLDKLFNKLSISSTFIKVSLKNSIQVIVKFIIGILNIKILAVYVGPTGMALVSQLINFIQLGSNFSGLGFNSGVIKYIASNQHSNKKQDLIISTSFICVLVFSIVLGITIAIFPKLICNLIYNNDGYYRIIQFSGIFLTSTASLNLYISILNGLQNLKYFIRVNLATNITGFCISLFSVWLYGLIGLLWGQLFTSFLTAIIAFVFFIKRIRVTHFKFSFLILKRLSKYSLMAITSGILSPLSIIIMRKIIILDLGEHTAGLWDGINKISNNYIMLLTLSFSYYFLPRFASIRTNKELNNELIKIYKILLPILILGAGAIFSTRTIIIRYLFSSEFNQMSDFFLWQNIGDVFRVLSWVIGYLFIAKEKVVIFISTEITSIALQVLFLKIINLYELNLTMYYGIENIFYFIIMFSIYKYSFRTNYTSPSSAKL